MPVFIMWFQFTGNPSKFNQFIPILCKSSTVIDTQLRLNVFVVDVPIVRLRRVSGISSLGIWANFWRRLFLRIDMALDFSVFWKHSTTHRPLGRVRCWPDCWEISPVAGRLESCTFRWAIQSPPHSSGDSLPLFWNGSFCFTVEALKKTWSFGVGFLVISVGRGCPNGCR